MKDPEFKFARTEEIDFNAASHNLDYLLAQIAASPDTYFQFNVKGHHTYAYGAGATRYVYHLLSKELVDSSNPLMIVVDNYFMDINESNCFWQDEANIKCFVIFVGMVIRSGCTLPFHFHPTLLEAITHSELSGHELKFFMEWIDPEMLANAEKISSADFDLLGTEFKTHNELYRSKVIGIQSELRMTIHYLISECMSFFDSFNDYEILAVDTVFGGNYDITPSDVIAICNVRDGYADIWTRFVKSLNENELKRMLIMFGNTLSMKKQYYITIDSLMTEDISIETCTGDVYINKRYFKSDDDMQKLRTIFECDDTICDKYSSTVSTLNDIDSPQDIVLDEESDDENAILDEQSASDSTSFGLGTLVWGSQLWSFNSIRSTPQRLHLPGFSLMEQITNTGLGYLNIIREIEPIDRNQPTNIICSPPPLTIQPTSSAIVDLLQYQSDLRISQPVDSIQPIRISTITRYSNCEIIGQFIFDGGYLFMGLIYCFAPAYVPIPFAFYYNPIRESATRKTSMSIEEVD